MRDLLQQVAAETCTTPSLLTQRLLEARQRIHGLVANNQGKFRVLKVDTYDNVDSIVGEFDSREEAIRFAQEKAQEAKPYDVIGFRFDHQTGRMIKDTEATIHFYAYTPVGSYINPTFKKENQE